MTKYLQFYQDMLKQNKQLFDSFREVHDNFVKNPEDWKAQFNEVGRDVQDVARRYENRLCGQSEGTKFSKFSTNLADKFQHEIKKDFPKYDFIGAD